MTMARSSILSLLRLPSTFAGQQEADIQELRKRLMDEGRFSQALLEAGQVLDESGDVASPVLMEVLQASARVSVPDAAKRRIWELRKRAGLPPLPDEELLRAIRSLQLGPTTLDLVPSTLSLSHSWQANHPNPSSEIRYASRYATAAEQQLGAQHLALGLRTVVYGMMGTVLAVGGGVTAVAYWYDLRGWEDCRNALRAWGVSWRAPIRAAMLPWAAYAQRLAPRWSPAGCRGRGE